METKKQLMEFKFNYFMIAVSLFVIEIIIALFIKDNFIRPYVGDVLVVILIYCVVKSFINTPIFATAIAVLLFSFVVETLQYFHFIKLIGLEKSTIASVVIGTDFAWEDLLAYIIGIAIVLVYEQNKKNRLKTSDSGL
jgi:hypothetical protein